MKIKNAEEGRKSRDSDSYILRALHDLKTPITSIHGYIQLLNKKVDKFPPTEAKWVKELMKESNRLVALAKKYKRKI